MEQEALQGEAEEEQGHWIDDILCLSRAALEPMQSCDWTPFLCMCPKNCEIIWVVVKVRVPFWTP